MTWGDFFYLLLKKYEVQHMQNVVLLLHQLGTKRFMYHTIKFDFDLFRFGDDFILPDPRGIIESEEQFLKDYEAAVEYDHLYSF